MTYLYSVLATEGGGWADVILPYIPIALAVICGVILLVAFCVGCKKGARRVSWTGLFWLIAAVLFCLLQGVLVEKIAPFMETLASKITALLPMEGEALTKMENAASAFLPAFTVALGVVLIALIVYGVFALFFRPKIKYVRKNSDVYVMDENGFEYDEDYEDYDDYEEYTSRRAPVRIGCGTPSFFGRVMGGLLCLINAAMITATVVILGLFLLNATTLKDGALAGLFTYKVADVEIVPLIVAFAQKYAMDVFLIGILVAFACKGRKNGFMESLRKLLVNIGSIVAVALCFWLPFSKLAVQNAEGTNLLASLVGRCGSAMTTVLGEKLGQFGPTVGKILAGILLAVVVILFFVLLNWIMKKLVAVVEKYGFTRSVDGALAGLIYLVFGIIVCVLVWVVWYVLARYGIFNVEELFTSEATLSKGLFDVCDASLSPLLDKMEAWFQSFGSEAA